MTPGIAERERIAARLRELVADWFDDGEFYDRGEVEDVLGLATDDGAWYEAAGVRRLADLVEPSAWRAVVEDNERLLERCRELEKENYALKSGGRWRGGRS